MAKALRELEQSPLDFKSASFDHGAQRELERHRAQGAAVVISHRGERGAGLDHEVNLGVTYTDADVGGHNETNFTFSRLDTTANQWLAVTKQATDPPANFASATVTEMGYYVLHLRS